MIIETLLIALGLGSLSIACNGSAVVVRNEVGSIETSSNFWWRYGFGEQGLVEARHMI